MLDPLAYAMAQDAVKRTQAQFAPPPRGVPRRDDRPATGASLRTLAARRLRGLADRLEPVELDRAA